MKDGSESSLGSDSPESAVEKAAAFESAVPPVFDKASPAPARPASPYRDVPQHGSLFGIVPPDDTDPIPAPPPPVALAMVDQDSFGAPSANALQRHPRGGVVAAPPLLGAVTGAPAGTTTGSAASFFASLVGMASTNSTTTNPRASTGPELRRGRQVVAAGNQVPDHFEVREGDFAKPAGRVVCYTSAHYIPDTNMPPR